MFKVLFINCHWNREWFTADRAVKTYDEACLIANEYDKELTGKRNAPTVHVVRMNPDGSATLMD